MQVTKRCHYTVDQGTLTLVVEESTHYVVEAFFECSSVLADSECQLIQSYCKAILQHYLQDVSDYGLVMLDYFLRDTDSNSRQVQGVVMPQNRFPQMLWVRGLIKGMLGVYLSQASLDVLPPLSNHRVICKQWDDSSLIEKEESMFQLAKVFLENEPYDNPQLLFKCNDLNDKVIVWADKKTVSNLQFPSTLLQLERSLRREIGVSIELYYEARNDENIRRLND
jgi:hypothetical protein